MRFLTGLLIGAVLTFGIATAVGLPTYQIIDWVKARLPATGLVVSDVVPVVLPDVLDVQPQQEVRPTVVVEPQAIPSDPVDHGPDAPTEIAASVEEVMVQAEPETEPEREPEPAVERDPEDLRTEIVWVAFRSERSAAGFADHMSETLDHPFSVQREGAGRYHVAFEYTSPDEREVVLSQVKQITGANP
ncbi:MAG: hypothetical protein O3A63_19870 [Proteobacteria bacterium]|nr:hypothetical protein [Pseudomonadota bacterium]